MSEKQNVYAVEGNLTIKSLKLKDAGNKENAATGGLIRVGDEWFIRGANGQLFKVTTSAVSNTGSNTGSGGTGSEPNTPTNPNPPTSEYQDGSQVFLADGTSMAPFDDPETSTSRDGVTFDAVNGEYKMEITGSGQAYMGGRKSLGNEKAVRLDFSIFGDSGLNITDENTVIHIWAADASGNWQDFVEVRLTKEFKGDDTAYNILLRFANTGNFADSSFAKRCYSKFYKGTKYPLQLYILETGFAIIDEGQVSGLYVPLFWVDENYQSLDVQNKFFDGLNIGQFGGKNASGTVRFDDIAAYQEYVYPNPPTTLEGKCRGEYDGWKKRFLYTDGKIIKEDGDKFNDNQGKSRPNKVSEADAYGSLFSTQFNDQDTFDLRHSFSQQYMRRSNNGDNYSGSHLGWLLDPITNQLFGSYGLASATDADIDNVVGYHWAGNLWGNAGAINYHFFRDELTADFKANHFIDYKGGKLMDAGSYNQGNERDVNASYLSPGHYQIMKNFTGDTFWDDAIDGTYAYLTDLANTPLYGRQPSGYPSDWTKVNASNNTIFGSGEARSHFSFDAFRTIWRVYLHWLWFQDQRALDYFNLKLKKLYEDEWRANGAIYANHTYDGIPYGGDWANPGAGFENSAFTFMAYLVLKATGSSMAQEIWDSKLKDLYAQSPMGDYWRNAPGGKPGYYVESWVQFPMMAEAGLFNLIT